MTIRSRKVIRLGSVRVDIRSNELDFKGFLFFSEWLDPDDPDSSDVEPDFVLRGSHYWIFTENFEPILWPYAVKYLLTLYSMDNLLHLKTAGIALEGQETLLVGRRDSGKVRTPSFSDPAV